MKTHLSFKIQCKKQLSSNLVKIDWKSDLQYAVIMITSFKNILTFTTDVFDISVRLTHINYNLVNGSSVKMVVVTETLILINLAPCSLRLVTLKLLLSSLPNMVIITSTINSNIVIK